MAHVHSVYDTDTHFSIDPITRQIKTTDQKKVMLIQGDHNSERITFEVPRFIGHDMMECTAIEVHFVNTETANKPAVNVSKGFYTVTDKELSQESEEVVVFTWLIAGSATKYIGELSFGISFICKTGNETDYQWSTGVYSAIHIEESIFNREHSDDEHTNTLKETLIDKMLPIMKAGIYVPEQSDNIMGFEITLTGYGVSQYSDQLTVKKDVTAEYEETILAI